MQLVRASVSPTNARESTFMENRLEQASRHYSASASIKPPPSGETAGMTRAEARGPRQPATGVSNS
jgi:hypothetical protein